MDATIRDHGFYAQDAYRVTRNLTLNYGMRYEYAALPQPTVVNPDYPQTGHINSPTMNLEPRVGLAYSMNNNKTVLRASYGMFHARFPGSLIDNLWTNNGVYQLTGTFSSTNATQLAAGPVYPTLAGATVQRHRIFQHPVHGAERPELRTPSKAPSRWNASWATAWPSRFRISGIAVCNC